MKIGAMDLKGVPIFNKDFAGGKFGPDQRSFSTVIADPGLQEKLMKDGVRLYFPPRNPDSVEPPVGYLTVKLDNRYHDVDLIGVFPNDTVVRYDDSNYKDLDDLWIRNADIYVVLNQWEKKGRVGVTAYIKTGVFFFMSEEEKSERQAAADDNPVKRRYSSYF